MSDDWSTVSMGRDKALGREIEVLRKRYLEHADLLEKMIAGAPSEHLAKEYVRLKEDIDESVRKLDELGRGVGTAPNWEKPHARPQAAPAEPVVSEPHETWSPATSELRHGPASPIPAETAAASTGTRILLIGLAGLAVLVVLGFLAWRYLSGAPHGPQNGITDVAPPVAATETAVAETAPPAAATPAPAAPAPAGLQLQPASWDYGTVRKGTRQTHQFRIVNDTPAPLTLAVARSACRCLWFEHPAAVPAGVTATLTVTVDGARAKAGTLRELVKVSSKNDPSVSADLELTASVQ